MLFHRIPDSVNALVVKNRKCSWFLIFAIAADSAVRYEKGVVHMFPEYIQLFPISYAALMFIVGHNNTAGICRTMEPAPTVPKKTGVCKTL